MTLRMLIHSSDAPGFQVPLGPFFWQTTRSREGREGVGRGAIDTPRVIYHFMK